MYYSVQQYYKPEGPAYQSLIEIECYDTLAETKASVEYMKTPGVKFRIEKIEVESE